MLPHWLQRLPDARTPVLFEDGHLLIIGKPAGVYLPGQAVVVGLNLFDLLLHHQVIGPRDVSVFKPVNRLAATESGIVILAKTGLVATALDRMFRESPVQQTWWAVVEGAFKPKAAKASNDEGPARRAGKGKSAPGARVDSTEVWGRSDQHTVVRVAAHGGSRMDMRAFFRSRFHPVVGDRRGRLDTGEVFAGRCFLHLSDFAFAHPMTGRGVKVKVPPPRCFEGMGKGGEIIDDALSTALLARAQVLGDETTTAFRLLNGSPDGVRGLTAEVYSKSVVMWYQPDKFKSAESRLPRAGKFYQRVLGAEEVIHKASVKDRGATTDEADADIEDDLDGGERGRQFILENGLKFWVRLKEGLGTGLFLDQRDNRQRLREMAGGKRVLNTFAHTCGFSVAAAAGGAAETVSVDISRTYLEWGRQNFEANGLVGEQHEFVRAECFEFLERCIRKERRFDIVVLDPPTFSRSKRPKRVFSLSADLSALVDMAVRVLGPSGILLVNINSRAHSPKFLASAVRKGCGDRKGRVMMTPRLPPDFASDPRHSKSIWVQLDGSSDAKPRRRFIGEFADPSVDDQPQ